MKLNHRNNFILLFLSIISFNSCLPKYSDVSSEKPFSDLINRKLVTKTPVVLAKNPTSNPKKYPNIIEDNTGYGIENVEKIAEIPIGTEFRITSVRFYTGRVSGTTSAYIFGKVYVKEHKKEYPFEYTWGDYYVIYEDKPYWKFPLAFWLDQALEEKYFIKVP